jgi:hypothetical protein
MTHSADAIFHAEMGEAAGPTGRTATAHVELEVQRAEVRSLTSDPSASLPVDANKGELCN